MRFGKVFVFRNDKDDASEEVFCIISILCGQARSYLIALSDIRELPFGQITVRTDRDFLVARKA